VLDLAVQLCQLHLNWCTCQWRLAVPQTGLMVPRRKRQRLGAQGELQTVDGSSARVRLFLRNRVPPDGHICTAVERFSLRQGHSRIPLVGSSNPWPFELVVGSGLVVRSERYPMASKSEARRRKNAIHRNG